MMAWVSTYRIRPPSGQSVMVRFGASIFWAAHCRWRNKWFMLVPGGSETEIAAPSFWWCRDETDASNESATEYSENIPKERVSFRRSKHPQQLSLFDDSEKLSQRRVA